MLKLLKCGEFFGHGQEHQSCQRGNGRAANCGHVDGSFGADDRRSGFTRVTHGATLDHIACSTLRTFDGTGGPDRLPVVSIVDYRTLGCRTNLLKDRNIPAQGFQCVHVVVTPVDKSALVETGQVMFPQQQIASCYIDTQHCTERCFDLVLNRSVITQIDQHQRVTGLGRNCRPEIDA